MITTLEPILKEHAFFANLSPEYLTLVTGCAKNIVVEEGKFLFREKEKADAFFLLREGRLSLEVVSARKGPIVVESLGAGDVVGWSWLFPPYEWHFDARALTRVRAISLDAVCLRGKCEKDTQLGYEMMKRLTGLLLHRLQSTRLRLVEAYEEFDA